MRIWILEVERLEGEGRLTLASSHDRDDLRIPFILAAWEITPHGVRVEEAEMDESGSLLLIAGDYALTVTPVEPSSAE